MYSELPRHDSERHAFLVPRCGQGHGLVGHFADHAPSSDAGSVEMLDDSGPVDAVPTGESVDRGTVSVEADQCIDLARWQSSLDRV